MRFLVRLFGYGLVAFGFVALVIDGARSIADSRLQLTSLGDALQAVLHERSAEIAPVLARNLHPWLADPVFTELVRVPASALFLLLGFALLRLGRAPRPAIGVLTRQ